jgi:hypothetical protein
MFMLLAGAGALAALSSRTSHAAGPALMSIDVDPSMPGIQHSVEYPEGTDQIEIDVVIENAYMIGAFEFLLSFDVVSLQFLSWAVGPFLGSTGRPVNCLPLITENTIRLGCTSDGPTPDYGGLDGPSGDGVLAQLYFHPRFTGTTCFPVMLVETAEVFGHPLPTNIGAISCVTIVPKTPTPTFTPTATGTAIPSVTRSPIPSVSATASRTATASKTVSPSVTVHPSVTVSPTVLVTTTAEATSSPRASSSPQRTSTREATSTSVIQVLSGNATGTPGSGGSTVLGSPSGLPRAGSHTPGIPHSTTDWLITGMGLTIGILLVLLIRQTVFAEDDDDGVWR